MVKIAPSMLGADFGDMRKAAMLVAPESGYLHMDVMDGHFVPNLTMGSDLVKSLKGIAPLDVHLMIENADCYIKDFANARSDIITVHVEACPHLNRTIQLIKEQNVRAGVVLNPATPLSSIEEILHEVDLVLLMSVNPGFGGQAFIPSMLDKIQNLNDVMCHYENPIELEVDGGIKAENAGEIKQAGATVLVAGSAIFNTKDYKKAIKSLREA